MRVSDLDWLQRSIALGRTTYYSEAVIMTPEVAGAILSANDNNRNIAESHIVRLISELEGGRWVLNGEPIIISHEGLLNDGQHRLTAVLRSKIAAPMVVSFGLTRDSRLTVDQGTARTAGNFLTMVGVQNSFLIAGIARLVMMFEAGDGTRFSHQHKTTNTAVVARAQSDDHLVRATKYTSHNFRNVGICKPSVFGAAYYVASKVNPAVADEFFSLVASGELIKRGDPAFAVRAALMNLRVKSSAAQFELLLRGWAAHVEGRELLLAKVLGSFPPVGMGGIGA